MAPKYREPMGRKENKWIASVDPAEAWYEGWGQLARYRSIAGTVVSEFGVAALLYIYGKNPAYGVAVMILSGGTLLGLLAFRRTLLTAVRAGSRLHELCHFIRDESGEILQSTAPTEQAKYQERHRNLHPQVAERIAGYFRAVCNDPSVCCAIRLADTGGGKQEYRTVGRSSGMDPSRAQLSEPIALGEGICDVVRKKGQRGVVFIRDIKEAVEQGWWKECKSDKLPDVKSLLIVPINGYVLGTKTMLGLLYVTSPKDVFRLTHAEPLKALADMLGSVYPVITGRLIKEN